MPFIIPSEIDPEETICVPVHVPLNDEHIAAFWGALDELGKHWSWENHIPDTTGAVSRVWQAVIKNAHTAMGACDMAITSVICHCVEYPTPCSCEFTVETGVLEIWLSSGAPGETGAKGETGDKGDKGDPGTTFPPPIIPAPTGTEEEKKTIVFSGAMAIVKYLQEKILEFYQAAEGAASAAHAVKEWYEIIPLLETFDPVGNIIEAADEILEATLAYFQANDTEELREQLACEIFCFIVANDYAFDMYVWNVTLIYWATELLSNLARPHYYLMGTFWPFEGLANRYVLGMNDDNEDWALLCSCAASPYGIVTFDDAETDLDYVIDFGILGTSGNPDNCAEATTWKDGEEYDDGRQVIVTVELPTPQIIARTAWDRNAYNSNNPDGEVGTQITWFDEEMVEIDTENHNFEDEANNTWHSEETFKLVVGVKFVKFRLWFSCNECGTIHIYLDNLRIGVPGG